MKPRDLLHLVVLAALWGASFLFMRVAAPEFGPLALIELRIGIAAVFLLVVLAARGRLGLLRMHGSWPGAKSRSSLAIVAALALALLAWPAQLVSLTAWASVVVMGVACTGIAYILYFKLIASVGPARAIAVTFLVPAFANLWGAAFLGESITMQTAAAGLVVLAGTALSTGLVRPARSAGAPESLHRPGQGLPGSCADASPPPGKI